MATAVPHIFVSATTHDLASYREVVTQELHVGKLHPVVQEYFGPDHRRLSDYLRDQISECDAVICLIGQHHGSGPEMGDAKPRSYTQIEYDIAVELDKPIYVFMTDAQCVPDNPPSESAELQSLQDRHRQALMRAEHKCRMFSTHEQLRLGAAQVVTPIHELVGRRRMFYLHPPKAPAYFVGREAELQQLHASFREATPAVIVVVGMGGQGKTTLVHQAVRTMDYFPFSAGFWCTAYRTGFNFDMFLDEMLTYLLRGNYDKRATPDVQERLMKLMSLLQKSPVLLVIDGFERWLRGWEVNDLPRSGKERDRAGRHESTDSFLQQATGLENGTQLVLTTRALPSALDRSSCRIIPVVPESASNAHLQGLDPEAAIDLLRRFGIDVDDRREEFLKLAASFEHHPLALEVLGGLLVEDWGGRIEKLPIVRRSHEFQDAIDELFAEGVSSFKGTATEVALHTACLCIENPSLQTLAAALGLEADSDHELLHRDVKVLSKRNLIGWDGRKETVRVHPLVKQHFAPLAADPEAVHGRLVEHYSAQQTPRNASTLEHARPRLLAIEHALLANEVARAVQLLYAPFVADYTFLEWLTTWGHLDTGIELLERLAKASDSTQRLKLQSAHAAFLRQLGRLSEAERVLDRVLETLVELAAGDERTRRSLMASAHLNRANVYWQMSRFPDAVAEYDRALNLLEQLMLEGAVSLVDVLNARMNRGHALHGLGDLDAAIADLQIVSQMAEHLAASVDSRRELTAAAGARLALVLASLREHEAARRQSSIAIKVYRDLIASGRGELLWKLANELINQGSFLAEAGDIASSLSSIQEGVRIADGLVRGDRTDLETLLARGQMSLAHVFVEAGEIQHACRSADLAIATFERLAKDGRKDVRGWLSHALFNRAIARHRCGDARSAIADLDRARELATQLLAENEWDMRIIRLRKAVQVSKTFSPDQAAPLLADVIREIFEFFDAGFESQYLQIELAVAWRRLASSEAGVLAQSDLDLSLVDRWRQLAETRPDV